MLRIRIYDLLRLCGQQAEAKLKDKGLASKRFQPAATAQNRKVRLDAPQKMRDQLYGLEFTLEADGKEERIHLYAVLVPKASALDDLKARLTTLKVPFELSGALLYGPGIPLEKDKRLEDLAHTAAKTAVELFKCLE